MTPQVRELAQSLLAGELDAACAGVAEHRGEATGGPEIYSELITPAMYWIGDQWRLGEVTVAQEHLATATALRLLSHLREPVVHQPHATRVLLTCVEGERHELGLQMVAEVLRLEGYEILNLGPDLPVAALREGVAQWRPAVVGLSVTMRPHLPALHRCLSALGGAKVRVALGGQGVPSALREFAPWNWSRNELTRLDLLPTASEVLAAHSEHLRQAEIDYRELRDPKGEAAVRAAALEADAARITEHAAADTV